MSEQAGLPGLSSAAEHVADLREREDDPTPRGVARACLEALAAVVPLRGATVIDVCAGWGCWASEARRIAGGDITIAGLEIDGRKREHLARWCDRVEIGEAMGLLRRGLLRRDQEADVMIGNPAFSLLAPKVSARPDDGELAAAAECSLVAAGLRAARAVLLLHHGQAFVRGRVGRAVLRAYPPSRSWQVPGAVSFRSDGKTDSRCYAATLWERGHSGPCLVSLLPELGREDLRWRVPPGTEDPATARAMGLLEVAR